MASQMVFEFLDVGMGDGTLVIMGNTDATRELALIDLGVQPFTKFKVGRDDAFIYLKTVISQISKARGKTQPYIDHLYITHPDQDHYNAIMTLIELQYPNYGLEDLSIGKLTYGGAKGSYGKLISKIKPYVVSKGQIGDLANKQHSPVQNDGSVTPQWTFCGGDIEVFLLSCNHSTKYDDPNPTSLCLMFKDTYGNKVIFMGDAEADVEKQIIKNYKNADVSFLDAYALKLGHHGSQAGTSQKWINYVQPAAIFASGDFVWAHPYCATIERVINSKVLKKMYSHWFCCGKSDKEYFNMNTDLQICHNLWYVVKESGGQWMLDEQGKKSWGKEGLTYGVQWELNFVNGKPQFLKTETYVPE